MPVPQPRPAPQPAPRPHYDDPTNLYVGGLPLAMGEGPLRALFEPVGLVVDVKVITDRATGLSRGFGFVRMADIPSAEAAIASLNGYLVWPSCVGPCSLPRAWVLAMTPVLSLIRMFALDSGLLLTRALALNSVLSIAREALLLDLFFR
jgi:RNA recognition motif-containing protein